MNQARKRLGFGFWPEKGTAVAVEEIGAVSDDEEIHGEYQQDTTGLAGDKTAYWRLSLEEVVSHDGRFKEYVEACTSDCVSLRNMEANQSGGWTQQQVAVETVAWWPLARCVQP